jgi:hypothetical protein
MKVHQTDEKLNDRSFVKKKPKIIVKVGTGMHDEMKAGSGDEESATSIVFTPSPDKQFKKPGNHHLRQNSLSKPKQAIEVLEKVKVEAEKEQEVNMDAINEEEFSSDEE